MSRMLLIAILKGQGRDGGRRRSPTICLVSCERSPSVRRWPSFGSVCIKRKPLPVALDTGGLLREERTAR